MTISNKSSLTGPIPGWDVGLTSTNYRTCITLIYRNYTSSGLVFKLHLLKLSEWAKIKGTVTYRKLLVCIK